MHADPITLLLLGLCGGAVNAVAGGGPILVVAALATFGVAADIASLTSTVALLPAQVATGWRARHSLTLLGPPRCRCAVAGTALIGGATGAAVLLVTPAQVFARMLPLLIGMATALYAWNSRVAPGPDTQSRVLGRGAIAWLVPLAVYGGFYGGGNSFMVLALLAHAGIAPRPAAHAKNSLILLMNAAASVIFLVSGEVAFAIAPPLAIGALAGAAAGVMLIDRLDPGLLRWLVIVLGTGLALWLAIRG